MKQRFMNWMKKNNRLFSVIAGETLTNAQVVYAHIGLVVILALMGFSESLLQ